mgnify:CR=1 FL=1
MKDNDTSTPRRKVGRPRVLPLDQRCLSFFVPAEQAEQLDALLPRSGQRSAALREALDLVLSRLSAAQAPAQAQDP